jgi:hypothetical protein
VLHPRAADPQDGFVPTDDRSDLATCTGQERRDRARPQRRHLSSRVRRRRGRMDARPRSSRRESCAYQAVRNLSVAPARMHSVQGHPSRWRTVSELRIPAQRPPKPVVYAAGELAEVARNRTTQPNVYDPATRAMWLGMLTAIAQERGYKPGWVAVNYKEKFGQWPPSGVTVMPIPPSPEVRSWVRSRLIAYAKSRASA